MEKLLFCKACGSFRPLVPTSDQEIVCMNCDYKTDLARLYKEVENRVEVVPIERSQLLHQLYTASDTDSASRAPTEEAVIEEPCPKCAHPKMSFHTAQLRGVDEGQTIFYTCLNPQCGHKYTVNS